MAGKRFNYDFFIQLLHSETEDEVLKLLKEKQILDDGQYWKPYGDLSMNRSIVGNQQSSAVAALVEKLVNSIDAILMVENYRIGNDPRSQESPQNMKEAVQTLFNVPEGKIQNLLPKERTQLASKIYLIATGTKKNPNYVIVDEGEGQEPHLFPDTFLSLIRENKTHIPFVQGKFNMGGTGVLQFSGANSFQLIVSRRHNEILNTDRSQNRWGFTIIRRINPGPKRPHSTYVYLCQNGDVPSFFRDEIPVKPGDYPIAYQEPMQSGTLIKLWNYKLKGGLKGNLMFDMRRALEKQLPDPVLPIRLFERRAGYRAHSFETTIAGLSTVISDSPDDIEPGLQTGSTLTIQNVGQVHLKINVIKEEVIAKKSNPKYPKGGVLFTVNGQLHSYEPRRFIENRTKLDYIANTTLVEVDCTDLGERVREDLFLGSRDRMRDSEERDILLNHIAEYLRDHSGLKELNSKRRLQKMESSIAGEDTIKVIKDLIKSDPTLTSIFNLGKEIKIPAGPNKEPEPYVGNEFPTYFKLYKEPKSGLVRNCPKNKRTRIIFETDAKNDYFSRTKDRGRIEIEGSLVLVSPSLWNGRATLTFNLPDNCVQGDTYNIWVGIDDVSRVDPFVSTFQVVVTGELPHDPTQKGSKRLSSFTIGLPNIKEVRRDEWSLFSFNEKSVISIKFNPGNDDDLDIAINIDNLYLRNEKIRRRSIEPEILEHLYKYGIFIMALGMLHSFKNDKNNKLEAADIHRNIERACEGLAITIIPTLLNLSKTKI